jgi:hypothetical protein
MEKYNTWRRVGSYSIDRQLVRNLEEFVHTGIPRILYAARNLPDLSPCTSMTISGSGESKLFNPMGSYTEPVFANDTQGLRIDLQYKEAGPSAVSKAIVIQLRLGKSIGDSDLAIALQDHNAKEKARVIEEGLLNALKPNRNGNSFVYPNEFIPTFIFVAGFIIGLGGLMFDNPLVKSICVTVFAASIYFVAKRFTKGYCQFESILQRKLDLALKTMIGLLLVLVLLSWFLIFR